MPHYKTQTAEKKDSGKSSIRNASNRKKVDKLMKGLDKSNNKEIVKNSRNASKNRSKNSTTSDVDTEDEDEVMGDDMSVDLDMTLEDYGLAKNGQSDVPEKDNVELELEKTIFGDEAGFRDNIKSFNQRPTRNPESDGESEEEKDEEEGEDFAGVTDQDLFFMDTTGTTNASKVDKNEAEDAFLSEGSADDYRSTRKAAWHDSDDDRLTVSLATVPRLRKLRITADEDVVSGKVYIKRLQKQYTLLNPTPDWVIAAREQPARKKRRLSAGSDDSDNQEGVEVDDDNLSAKPIGDLLRSNTSLIQRRDDASQKRKLRPEVIDIQRTKDIGDVQQSAITCLSFHPSLPLLLSSGPSGTLYLHHITSSSSSSSSTLPNPLLTSLHIRNLALSTSAFHPLDTRIFLSARRRYFHTWDLATGLVTKTTRIYGQSSEQKSMGTLRPSPCGRFVALKGTGKKGGGTVNILDAKTLQWTSQVRVESLGGIADFSWWGDGRGICIAGRNGEVTEWDVDTQTVVGRWNDQGAVGITVIALGGKNGRGASATIGTDRWIAVGSSSGVVNVYDRREWYISFTTPHVRTDICPRNPLPTKVLDHLTTPISNLTFNTDAQVLCMSSKWKKDAMRLVHLPSCTVYKNWPTASTPLGRITSVAFGRVESGVSRQDDDGQEGKNEKMVIDRVNDIVECLVVGNENGRLRMWEIRY